jgi:hypothetical protein
MAFQVDQFMNVPEDEIETAGGEASGRVPPALGQEKEVEQPKALLPKLPTAPPETPEKGLSAPLNEQKDDVGTDTQSTAPIVPETVSQGASPSRQAVSVSQGTPPSRQDAGVSAGAENAPSTSSPVQEAIVGPQKAVMADASIQHEPFDGSSVYAFSERIEQGSGDGVAQEEETPGDMGGSLDAAMEAPPISMAVKQSMESDLAPPQPEVQPAKEAPTPSTPSQDPYSRPDLQLSMAALQQAASILQNSGQADAATRNAVSDASQALQNVALLQSMVRLLPTEGLKLKHGRPSRFKGITPHHGRWQARIKEARRDIHLGYFNSGMRNMQFLLYTNLG